jgi:hypothetical protein
MGRGSVRRQSRVSQGHPRLRPAGSPELPGHRPGGFRPGSAAPVAIRGPATSAGLVTGGGRDRDTRPADRPGSPRPAHRRRIRGLHAELHRVTLATAQSILVCPNLFPGPTTAVAAAGGRIAAPALNGIFCQTPALPRVPTSTASREQSMASANTAVAHGLPDRGSAAGGAKPHRPFGREAVVTQQLRQNSRASARVMSARPVDHAPSEDSARKHPSQMTNKYLSTVTISGSVGSVTTCATWALPNELVGRAHSSDAHRRVGAGRRHDRRHLSGASLVTAHTRYLASADGVRVRTERLGALANPVEMVPQAAATYPMDGPHTAGNERLSYERYYSQH